MGSRGDRAPSQRLLRSKLTCKGDRLELSVQRPSNLNVSGLIVDSRSSTLSRLSYSREADICDFGVPRDLLLFA